MPECSTETTEANRTVARKRIPLRSYAAVTVTVIASDTVAGTISIEVRDVANATRQCTGLQWGDESVMWAACPSTLTGATDPDDVGAQPAPNTAGTLYLSADFIRSFDPFIAGTPKFPDGNPEPPFIAPLDVAPSRLMLTGRQLQDGGEGTVDLWNPLLASRREPVVFHDGFVTVHLTPAGFAALGATFPIARLEEAVAAILRRENAREIAGAWQVVAASVKALESVPASRVVDSPAIAAIRRVIPSFQLTET